MGVHCSHSFIILFVFLSFLLQVFGQQSPSLPSALRLPPWLPSGVPKTASGKPIRCSPKNTKLNPSTHKLISECGAQAYCLAAPDSLFNSTQGICVSRSCRRDQYPYGYARFGGQSGGAAEVPWTIVKGKLMPVGDDDERLQSTLPPMCPEGSFCPDRGSGCQPKVESGGACELGRDEQCRNPPTNEESLAGSLNKAVCLNSKCVFVPLFLDLLFIHYTYRLARRPATQILNALCTFENITSVSDINEGLTGSGQFTSSVFRHNCLSPFLFCDLTALLPDGSGPTCQPTREVGQRCNFDEQCKTVSTCFFILFE